MDLLSCLAFVNLFVFFIVGLYACVFASCLSFFFLIKKQNRISKKQKIFCEKSHFKENSNLIYFCMRNTFSPLFSISLCKTILRIARGLCTPVILKLQELGASMSVSFCFMQFWCYGFNC